MGRAYLRLDPAFFDRKAIDQKYPAGAVTALIGVLCHAEHQPQRGRFRDVRVLKALLGPHARWIAFLLEHRDLVAKRGQLYVDGWDEWQEGDWKVGERVKRIRNRQRDESAGEVVTVPVTPGVTVGVTVENESRDSVGTVYNLSDGGRQSVIDSGGIGGKRSDSESGNPNVESRPPAAERPSGSNGWEKAIDVAARLAAAEEQGPEAFHLALSKSDLDAWATFGHEWDELKAAWIGRGLRHPPAGAVDEEGSQRQMLYEILDNWPSRVVAWTKDAPAGATARAVIAHVIARRDEERGEQLAEDEDRDASWRAEKEADRAAAPEVLRRVARA